MKTQTMLPKGRYIDVLTDFGFKRIFSAEPNKDLLIAFLNELFCGKKIIRDLVYNRNEHVGDAADTGTVIFDLTCTTADEQQFIIEVQRSPQANLKRRMLYYGSKLIADQAPKGNRREWNYAISEVYVIVIMDGFSMPDEDSNKDCLRNICLCNRDTGAVFYEDLGFIYIELVNFVKKETALMTDLDRWLYLLKNLSGMNKIPVYLRKPVFEKLFKIAEYSKLNREERRMYDVSLKQKWDNKAVLDYAMENGMKKGMEKGIEKGVEQKSHEVVKNLIANTNFEVAKIAALANVTEAFVKKVKAEDIR